MQTVKADIIAKLQKDILSLLGFKTTCNNAALDKALGPMKYAFPNNSFPLGAMHEFITQTAEGAAVTSGFVSAILGSLMRHNAAAVWIGNAYSIFPPALKSFGIAPDKVIFINLKKEKEILWAMEEALKCPGLTAVIGEMKDLNFTDSRRLQLAVEQSRVTGFIIRINPKIINTTACVSRWRITSLATELQDEMPGIGFPRWTAELMKIRNGKPGTWPIEYVSGRFRHIYQTAIIPAIQQKKAG